LQLIFGLLNGCLPQVMADGGYNVATVDLWSCDVILFVLLTGWFPFENINNAVLATGLKFLLD
jgi:serine/threonine protein kinase